MKKVRNPLAYNNPNDLPLFKWAKELDARHRRKPGYAAAVLARRYRLNPSHAAIYAGLMCCDFAGGA